MPLNKADRQKNYRTSSLIPIGGAVDFSTERGVAAPRGDLRIVFRDQVTGKWIYPLRKLHFRDIDLSSLPFDGTPLFGANNALRFLMAVGTFARPVPITTTAADGEDATGAVFTATELTGTMAVRAERLDGIQRTPPNVTVANQPSLAFPATFAGTVDCDYPCWYIRRLVKGSGEQNYYLGEFQDPSSAFVDSIFFTPELTNALDRTLHGSLVFDVLPYDGAYYLIQDDGSISTDLATAVGTHYYQQAAPFVSDDAAPLVFPVPRIFPRIEPGESIPVDNYTRVDIATTWFQGTSSGFSILDFTAIDWGDNVEGQVFQAVGYYFPGALGNPDFTLTGAHIEIDGVNTGGLNALSSVPVRLAAAVFDFDMVFPELTVMFDEGFNGDNTNSVARPYARAGSSSPFTARLEAPIVEPNVPIVMPVNVSFGPRTLYTRFKRYGFGDFGWQAGPSAGNLGHYPALDDAVTAAVPPASSSAYRVGWEVNYNTRSVAAIYMFTITGALGDTWTEEGTIAISASYSFADIYATWLAAGSPS